MSYYYLCVFSVDDLDTERETNEFFLKIFISSLQEKSWTKELLQNCIFVCFLLFSILTK